MAEMKKILICDDDDGITEVMRIILDGAGFKVDTLNSGRGIQRKVENYKPDIIFLDIWMPGIDGVEIAKLLKRAESTKNIPVIVVSALNDTEKKAKESGADGYLPKPFEMNDLINMVKKHIKNT